MSVRRPAAAPSSTSSSSPRTRRFAPFWRYGISRNTKILPLLRDPPREGQTNPARGVRQYPRQRAAGGGHQRGRQSSLGAPHRRCDPCLHGHESGHGHSFRGNRCAIDGPGHCRRAGHQSPRGRLRRGVRGLRSGRRQRHPGRDQPRLRQAHHNFRISRSTAGRFWDQTHPADQEERGSGRNSLCPRRGRDPHRHRGRDADSDQRRGNLALWPCRPGRAGDPPRRGRSRGVGRAGRGRRDETTRRRRTTASRTRTRRRRRPRRR